MTIEKIENHSQLMRSALLEQYRDRVNIEELIAIEAIEIQELEDLFDQMRTEVNLVNGYGKILDLFGANYGEPRNGATDAEYRLKIYTRIAINNGGCDIEFILSTVRRLVDPVSIIYRPLYPANFSLEIRKDELDANVLPLIRSLAPAGVGDVIITNTPEAELFLWGGVVNSLYQLIANDGGDDFPLKVDESGGTIYTLAVSDFATLAAPNSQGFGAVIPTNFVATDDDGATITFGDGSPWRLVSAGDEEFYTTTEYGGVFSGVI